MIRGTTPEYLQSISGYDQGEMTVYVTVSQKNVKVTKTNQDIKFNVTEDGTDIIFSLTQKETMSFKTGKAYVQVRFIDEDKRAYATEIGTLNVEGVLQDNLIDYKRR